MATFKKIKKKIKNKTATPNVGKDVEQLEPACIFGTNVKQNKIATCLDNVS